MSNTLVFDRCFLTKVSFFSESSASLHLLTEQGHFRVIALSFAKRFSYSLDTLAFSPFKVEVKKTAQAIYLYHLQMLEQISIDRSKVFFLIYMRHLVDYCAKVHFERKIFLGFRRFVDLLSAEFQQEYYYYALISFQFVLLDLCGLGSPSEQMKSLFENNLMSIEDIASIHDKMVSEETFLRLQTSFEELFQQHIGYCSAQGYFRSWITLLSKNLRFQKAIV